MATPYDPMECPVLNSDFSIMTGIENY